MKMGIRLKLFLVSVGLIVFSLVVADFYLSRVLEKQLTERIREDLLTKARLVAERVKATGAEPALRDERVYDALADELGRLSAARVTLVRRDGTVAGDSEVEAKNLRSLENHATRPEIAEAIGSGEGDIMRYSTTLHRRMMYVAVPIVAGQSAIGTARVAMPLTSVDQALVDLDKTLIAAALLALALAAVASLSVANVVSRNLRDITETAKRMASGNLSARTRAEGTDEIAALGRSLDQLAATLSGSLEQMRGERDLLSGILFSMNEGVLVVGRDRRIVLVNRALRDMLLLGPEAEGKNILHVIRNAELNRLLAEAERGEPVQIEIDLAGLKPRRAMVHAVTLSEAPGGILAVFVDVTELRRLESVRRDFVANASHELRSPLTTIRAATETLYSVKDDPAEAEKFIKIIERNAERVEHLVSDLLELARLESRDLVLHMEALSLAASVDRILLQRAAPAELKRIVVLNDIPSTTRVRADQRALENVVGNLVDNALKYCPPGATIRLQASDEELLVRVSVSDTGPGIAPQHLPRLFERFYRVDAGRSRELGGTGLGLSIVKHLAEAMGGSVGVDSQPGAGSTFFFTLQRA